MPVEGQGEAREAGISSAADGRGAVYTSGTVTAAAVGGVGGNWPLTGGGWCN